MRKTFDYELCPLRLLLLPYNLYPWTILNILHGYVLYIKQILESRLPDIKKGDKMTVFIVM